MSNKELATMEKEIEQQSLVAPQDALAILKSLQGVKKVVVPVIIEGQLLHEGIQFDVSVTDYNNHINLIQGQQASVTSSASTLLNRTVIEDHKAFLVEAIKIPGMLEFFMGQVMTAVRPEVESTLD